MKGTEGVGPGMSLNFSMPSHTHISDAIENEKKIEK